MRKNNFNLVAGIIFLLVALLHALRMIYDWQAIIGGWSVPLWASGVAVVIFAGLAYWALKSRE